VKWTSCVLCLVAEQSVSRDGGEPSASTSGEHLDINIHVTGAEVGDERIASVTRELLKDIRVDADPRARLVTQDAEADQKGGLTALGQIALALISGGAVKNFITAAFGFLGRHRKIEIEVQNSAGKKLKLKWDYIDRHGEESAIALVESFLTKGT
jgi:hypothetical protein